MSQPYSAAEGLVRVYSAETPDGTGLVWAHGGGFLFGDIDMPESDWVARQLAGRGTTVVTVDYRLAPVPEGFHEGVTAQPGHPYPAGSDDMVTAWRWTRAHAAELGLSPAALAIGGASAGGNLAAGAALRLAGTHEAPALVLLAYPTLLAVQPAPDAALRAALDANPDADMFGAELILKMYENYLAGPVDDAPLPAVPGRAAASDLVHYPPTFIVNGDVDELRVSAEHFAATLAAAGRDIEVITELGTQHGHLNSPEAPAATRSIERMAKRLAALSSELAPVPVEGTVS